MFSWAVSDRKPAITREGSQTWENHQVAVALSLEAPVWSRFYKRQVCGLPVWAIALAIAFSTFKSLKTPFTQIQAFTSSEMYNLDYTYLCLSKVCPEKSALMFLQLPKIYDLVKLDLSTNMKPHDCLVYSYWYCHWAHSSSAGYQVELSWFDTSNRYITHM